MCRTRTVFIYGLSFFLVWSVSVHAMGTQDNEKAIESVKTMIRSHEEFTQAGDLEGVLGNSADDVVIIAPGAPPIIGIEAYRDFEKAYLAAWDTTDFVHNYLGVTVEGNLVVAYGIARGKMTPKSGGETIQFANNFLIVARRHQGGAYKFAYVAFAPGG